jgi:signal transduction histidine kinase
MNNICGGLAIIARQKGLNFTLNVDKELKNKALFGDPTRITQIVFNLVNNAIKYNRPDGEITVTAQWVKSSYTISITDTGIGIAEEELPYIFNRFKKLKQSLSQDSFGLGLPIVMSIATFHKIGIIVNSEKGTGSTFTLTLPVKLTGNPPVK